MTGRSWWKVATVLSVAWLLLCAALFYVGFSRISIEDGTPATDTLQAQVNRLAGVVGLLVGAGVSTIWIASYVRHR